jgi:hypothetical protein
VADALSEGSQMADSDDGFIFGRACGTRAQVVPYLLCCGRLEGRTGDEGLKRCGHWVPVGG